MPGKGRGGAKGKGKEVAKKGRCKKTVGVAARVSSSSSDEEPPLLSLEAVILKKKGKVVKLTESSPAPPEPSQQGKTATRHEPAAGLPHDSSSDHEAVIPPSQSSLPASQPTDRQPVILTDEQEEDIVEWLKEHPMLYDKTDKLYR